MTLDDFSRIEERERSIEVAARTIVSLCKQDRFGKGWRPKGIDEVAILLETLGYSQEIVEDLWYTNLFAMAADVAALVEKYVADERVEEQRDAGWFTRACRDYAIGSLYAGPWVVAVIGLFVFGAALWSAVDTPVVLVTTASLGVFGALVVSGFFTQVIARRLAFYYFQDDYAMMRGITDRFVWLGTSALAIVALLAAGLMALGGFGALESVLGGAYLFASGVFQLALAPLYTLRRFSAILGIVAAAVLASGVSFRLGFNGSVVEPWEPIAQSALIALLGLAVIAGTTIWLRRLAGARIIKGDRGDPWWPAVYESVRPYGLFGALYFLAILVDHVAAGMSHPGRYAYNTLYEFGAGVGLFAAIPLTGAVNVALERLPALILSGAAGYRIGEEDAFNRRMLVFFLRALAAMCAVGVISWLAVVPIGLHLLAHLAPAQAADLRIEDRVLEISAAAYTVLMLGLFGCQLLFFLSRPRAPVAGALSAVAVSASVGTWSVLAHAGDVAPAYGLLAGTLVFAAIALLGAYRALRAFSASYYAAY